MSALTRRDFLKSSALAGGAVMAVTAENTFTQGANPAGFAHPKNCAASSIPALPDLKPAQWIWFPSERTLCNTFILFRKDLLLKEKPLRAQGWITADSRYLLEVNGKRQQWGPPPCDPRWLEADPIDLTSCLQAGKNTIGATVLFYGLGDGTSPIGKPGFLFWLEVEYADGKEKYVSDASWQCHLTRAWRPGQYKRWYLRSLQEEFDSRLYPYGWNLPDYTTGKTWFPAMPLNGSPNKPALSTQYYEYLLDVGSGPPNAELRPRSIPLMREETVQIRKLTESFWFEWRCSPQDYFDFRIPNAFTAQPATVASEAAPGIWHVSMEKWKFAVLTFELEEQVVGWPQFVLEAPAGTVVEMLVHEAHQVGGPPLLNSHFNSWTRLICKEGENRFEPFDFESFRWIQFHIHNTHGMVKLHNLSVRRRIFPWPHSPRIKTNEAGLQKLFDATINTLNNCAQETLVDGMARERQQYSGDGGHQLHAVHLAFGEQRLPARFLATWSQGMTKDGFFLDCWPAYDRLARLVERQLDLTGWGPILDHGVGFNFDCWHHHNYSGDLAALNEPYPRLLRFADYLRSIIGRDGLLPVENLGIPSVWIDHVAYLKQCHKQCAFNLYVAAMLSNALAPICRAMGDESHSDAATQMGKSILRATVKAFWSPQDRLFIVNRPWLAEEKNPRTCDRSLATAILYGQCPQGKTSAAIRTLAECPQHMGFSYPCNAGWRLWALAKGGRTDAILKDLRTRWAGMDSVKLNNTLQEDWIARPDSSQQWSHCAVAPVYVAYMSLAGIQTLEPGFRRVEIRPLLADLDNLELTAWTPQGPIHFKANGKLGSRTVELEIPQNCKAELVVRKEEVLHYPKTNGIALMDCVRYAVPSGKISFKLAHS